MSKTTDTTTPRELTDDHRPLADSELNAVSGGGDSDSGAFRGRYQLRLSEADKLLSAQGSTSSPPPQG
jgi:hypothetical protein